MGRVIQSPKQRVPVARQNGPRSNKNIEKKVLCIVGNAPDPQIKGGELKTQKH